MRFRILGIRVTSSILRVLLSGFLVSGSQVLSFRGPDLGSWVSGSHVPWSQFQGLGCYSPVSKVPGSHVPRSQSPRSQGLTVLDLWVPGLRVPAPWFQVLILDYALLECTSDISFGNCKHLRRIVQRFFFIRCFHRF